MSHTPQALSSSTNATTYPCIRKQGNPDFYIRTSLFYTPIYKYKFCFIRNGNTY
ncbi:hypothetical protein BACCELL_03953 [Bacteroides cellulosilyticus DSM 14838]|uniref:Uncharacterized protein n=1 Tax=Bacteroides cellulosilyticus DSM 14838 TaxID=537012 RepID=E2NI22_9BACE|nr:hypothetical protein BACCELL_03953 [Bacteroides cellulosilyticus DSM 14838]